MCYSAFLIQGGGGAAVAGNGSKTTRDTGKVIRKFDLSRWTNHSSCPDTWSTAVVAGLGFQEVAFIFFIAIAYKFHRFVLAVNKEAQREWGPLLYTLYASLVCITVSQTPPFFLAQAANPREGAHDIPHGRVFTTSGRHNRPLRSVLLCPGSSSHLHLRRFVQCVASGKGACWARIKLQERRHSVCTDGRRTGR